MSDLRIDHVIFHGGCVDGFTAAWLLHRAAPDATFHEGRYGEPPPDGLTGHVVIADFSYPPDVLWEISERVETLTVIDHHQTAVEQVLGDTIRVDGPRPPHWMLVVKDPTDPSLVGRATVGILDLEHSGAVLVDQWLGEVGLAATAARTLAEYVEDRDLWRFALPDSHEIVAYINAVPMTWADWEDLAIDLSSIRYDVIGWGSAILRRNRVLIDQMLPTSRPFELYLPDEAVFSVPMVASPYGLGSDVAGELAKGSACRIGGYYIDHPDRREFGLRSTEDGPDVARLAEAYGGGGHPHASGFRLSRETRAAQRSCGPIPRLLR